MYAYVFVFSLKVFIIQHFFISPDVTNFTITNFSWSDFIIDCILFAFAFAHDVPTCFTFFHYCFHFIATISTINLGIDEAHGVDEVANLSDTLLIDVLFVVVFIL